MPYADFQPQQGRDLFGENVNLMSRINADQRAQQEAQRAQAQFQILQPVLQAKAGADIASAQASVANATRMETFRQQAASESPDLNDEFLAALKNPDFQGQSEALAALQGKVAYMAVLPEYKGFVDAVNNARVQAHQSAIANMHIDAQTQIAQGAVQARERMGQANLDLRAQMQQNTIDSKAALEQQAAGHKQELAKVQAGLAGEIAGNKARATTAEKANEEMVQTGAAAQQPLAQVQTALDLLKDPDVRTGTGAAFQLKAERLGNLLGADFKGVEKTEQLNAILGQTVLDKAKLLKGAIAAKELAFLQDQAPTLSKSEGGIERMLVALQKGYQNATNIANIVNQGREAGLSSPEINNQVNDYRLNHSIFSEQQKPASKTPTVKTQGEFDALPSGAEFLTPSGKPRKKP